MLTLIQCAFERTLHSTAIDIAVHVILRYHIVTLYYILYIFKITLNIITVC